MNFDAMVARFIELVGMRPLILVWGVPRAGERSVFSFTGWCFGDGTCHGMKFDLRAFSSVFLQETYQDTYECQRCGRPRGEGLKYGAWHG